VRSNLVSRHAPDVLLCHDPTVSEVRISVGLPQLLDDEGAGVLTRYAARAEDLGFAGLWSLDSVPGAATARVAALEGLHTLTAAAVVTQTIRLGVAVIVLPARQPAHLARELATIDQLSGGRLTVGVGVGRDDPVPVSLGLPGDRRVARLRENLEVMRLLWSQDDVSYEGELYRFEGVTVKPKPVQRPSPPVWFGAGAPPALRRAARLGDGWMGAGSSPSSAFAEQLERLREALRDEGRDPSGFPVGKRVYIAVEDTEAAARERLTPRLDGFYAAPGITERVAVCGPPEACAEQLRELVDAGAGELLLNPLYEYTAQLERLAEVAGLVRAP
jgi:probable F420-dependent oxidoreductase